MTFPLRRATGRLTLTGLGFALSLNAATLHAAAAGEAAAPARPPIRFVIVHRPGPLWRQGVPVFEQPGLQAHVDHYRKLYAEGKLALGGPFMDGEGGGMMIAKPGIGPEELAAFAVLDPAVSSGLLTFAVRPWLVGMDASAPR